MDSGVVHRILIGCRDVDEGMCVHIVHVGSLGAYTAGWHLMLMQAPGASAAFLRCGTRGRARAAAAASVPLPARPRVPWQTGCNCGGPCHARRP
eukprot:16079629-Heterocapsa_arctica.AAC.1